ncbi:hypothetical protein MMC28_007361 [Mycoblastus sanguinarius]|nr:hypothetical protein [Mycoblastus sanguinarius]
MAVFRDLPNEIIPIVWQYVLSPSDIESFALVSKTIHALGAPFIQEYHRLDEEYSFFKNPVNCSGNTLARLLKDILISPHTALYVKTVHLGGWWDLWEETFEDDPTDLSSDHSDSKYDDPHVPYSKEEMDLFKDAIRTAKFVLPTEVDAWIRRLEEGNEDPIMALLLMLLPNVNFLKIEEYPPDTRIFTIVERIANSTAATSLSRLETVEILHETNSSFENVSLIKPFALLPSVKRISSQNLSSSGPSRDSLDCHTTSKGSNVTELTFERCGDIGRGLSEILRGFKGLRKFSFTSSKEKIYLPDMRAALLAYARHSLESLTITPRHELEGPMGSLRSFEKLRRLDTQLGFLVGPGGRNRQNLVDDLPASIEEVKLSGLPPDARSYLFPMMLSLVEAKKSHLQNLKKLEISLYPWTDRHRDDGLAELKESCEQNGVYLIIR